MSKYKCDRCKHLRGTLYKTYSANDKVFVTEYAECSERWTLAKLMNNAECLDFKEKK